jgi:hypothetical protein
MTTINKNKRIEFRVTEDEKDLIDNKAISVGLSTSEFSRRVTASYVVPSVADLHSIGELRRQGGLLKMIALQESDPQSKKELLIIAHQMFKTAQQVIKESAKVNAEVNKNDR